MHVLVLHDPIPPLDDGVVTLRRWSLDDLPCVEAASADPRIPEMTTVPAPYSDAAGRQFVARQWGRLDEGAGVSLAIGLAPTGEAVGCLVLLARPDRRAAGLGLGYWVVPATRRRGVATRAARLAVPWAFDALGADRVEALVEPANTASRRVLEAAGLREEGLLRDYLRYPGRRADAVVYRRLRGDAATPP